MSGSGLMGGSSGSSQPVDLTPKAFTNLRPLVANTLAQILQSGGPAYTTGDILGNTPFIPAASAGGQGAIQAPPPQQPQNSGMNPNSIMQMLQMLNQPNGPPRETGAVNHVTTGQRNQAMQGLASEGQGGDNMLAHINSGEAQLLKALGGSGTPNPQTGIMSFANPLLAALGQASSNNAQAPGSPVQAPRPQQAGMGGNPLLAALQRGSQGVSGGNGGQGGGQGGGGSLFGAFGNGNGFGGQPQGAKPVVAGNSGSVNTPVTGGLTSKQGGQPTQQIVNPSYQAPTPDSLVAPLTGDQNSIIKQIAANAGQTSPLNTAATGALTSQLNGTNPVTQAANNQLISTLNGSNLNGNPFLNAAIHAAQQDNTDTFNRVTTPGLLSRFAGNGQQIQGQGSSAFANVAGLAAKDFANTQSAVDTNMRSANYTNERNLQEGAVGQAQQGQANQIAAAAQANGLSNDQMQKLVTALQAVSLPQQVKDLGIQRGLSEYQQRMQTLLSVLQTAAGVSSPNVGNTSTQNSSGGIGSLLGGVGQGVGAAAGAGIGSLFG